MRQFNITGTCFPEEHYMVDISRQVEDACVLVRDRKYFTINRGRQYGKTTTLSELEKKLNKEGYSVFSIRRESALGSGGIKTDISLRGSLYIKKIVRIFAELSE